MKARTLWCAAVAAAALIPGVIYGVVSSEAATSEWTALPSGTPVWVNSGYAFDVGRPKPGRILQFRIYLAGAEAGRREAAVREVADPVSARYAQFLTPAQYHKQYGPSDAQRRKVIDWATGEHLRIVGQTAHYLAVTATVADVERAFHTSIHDYDYAGVVSVPAAPVSVPRALAGSIATVVGLDNPYGALFPEPAASSTSGPDRAAATPGASPDRAAAPSAVLDVPVEPGATGDAFQCSRYWAEHSTAIPAAYGLTEAPTRICGYTPQQLQAAYRVGPYRGSGATVAVVLEGALPTMLDDANRFFTNHGLPTFKPGQYTENTGPRFAETCRGHSWPFEEALDVETVHIVAPDANLVYVAANCVTDAAGVSFRGMHYLDAYTRIVDEHLADVATNSHSLDENQYTPALAAAWNLVLQQGALEGIGFTFNSGDGGGYREDPPATFPASSPWATGVGGTTLKLDANGSVVGELGWGDSKAELTADGTGYVTAPPGALSRGSSGGRSSLFTQPWYQRGTVPDELARDANGSRRRTVPDVAAIGDGMTGWLIGWTEGGRYQEVSMAGTSGSAPLLAGLQADAKQAAGHALGLLNPALYRLRTSTALRDVVRERDPGRRVVVDFDAETGTRVLVTLDENGALATGPGYDLVTGLGGVTGDFVELIARR